LVIAPIDESLIVVIEFGLADPAAVGELELIQIRAIPTGERSIDRIGKLAEPMRTGRREDPPRLGPIILTTTADQIHPNQQPRPRHD
jgi:hypothetical protein